MNHGATFNECLRRLEEWKDGSPWRTYEISYRPFKTVGAAQWTGGWAVMLWSTQWRKPERPLHHLGGQSLPQAVDAALKWVRQRTTRRKK